MEADDSGDVAHCL